MSGLCAALRRMSGAKHLLALRMHHRAVVVGQARREDHHLLLASLELLQARSDVDASLLPNRALA